MKVRGKRNRGGETAVRKKRLSRLSRRGEYREGEGERGESRRRGDE